MPCAICECSLHSNLVLLTLLSLIVTVFTKLVLVAVLCAIYGVLVMGCLLTFGVCMFQ